MNPPRIPPTVHDCVNTNRRDERTNPIQLPPELSADLLNSAVAGRRGCRCAFSSNNATPAASACTATATVAVHAVSITATTTTTITTFCSTVFPETAMPTSAASVVVPFLQPLVGLLQLCQALCERRNGLLTQLLQGASRDGAVNLLRVLRLRTSGRWRV